MAEPTVNCLASASIAAFSGRQNRLRAALAADGLDGLVVSTAKDIRYLTGFVGDDSLLVVLAGSSVLITDSRFDEFLEPWRGSGVAEVKMGVRHRLESSVRDVCRRRRIKRLGIAAEHLTVAGRARLSAQCGEEALVDTEGLISRLRMRKDDLELEAIQRAIAIQQEALPAALGQLSPEMTELQFSAALEYEMKVRGASGPSFDTIVAAGANSSIIHHVTGCTTIEHGTLLVDFGAVVDGYCSDMTRTFGVAGFPEKIRTIYEIVLEAQQAAIDHCHAGKTCAEVDAAARDVVEAAGYGKRFGHGLGHGIGLDIHEDPYFNDLATDVVLEPGMVMTVEPGIYLPGIGGVRIEDDVLITEDGCRVLTAYPKNPEEAIIEPVVQGMVS